MSEIKIYAFADEASGSLEGQIAAMRRNGLQGVELRNVNGVNVSDLTIAQAREIRVALEGEGLTVWSAGSPLGKIGVKDLFGPHLEKLKRTLEVCAELGARRIRMFSFYTPGGEDPADYRQLVLDRLGEMADCAEGTGIRLCHENEKGIYGDNAARCLDLLTAEPRLGGVFDPANFVQCGQDTLEAWALLKDRIDYLHIKDAFFADGRVVPAGKGEGHVPEIVADYLARGGTAVTVEPHLTVFAGLEALEKEGGRSAVGAYAYPSADAAFDAACRALKALL